MQRFAFLVFLLSAGIAGAESKPFAFNLGADAQYLGYSNDLETDVSGVLNDERTGMSFAGGHVFADISRYVTASAGAFYGVANANAANDGVARLRATPANSMLLLDLSAVLKYPVDVSQRLTFAPKVGIDALYYLAGNFDGASPSSDLKAAVSPYSFVVGADTDYTFPNGLFLRLPLEATYALNSRPSSVGSGYIASNTVTFRVGIGVGYKLMGFDRAEPPPPTPQPEAAPPQVEPADTETKPEPAGLRFAAGGGLSFLSYVASQTISFGADLEFKQTLGHGGFYGFFDITDYVSVYAGMLFGIGDVGQTITSQPDQGLPNRLISWEAGGEVKYPIPVSSGFVVAPLVGAAYVGYLSGKVGTTAATSDDKKLFSPLLLTAGADCDWSLSPQVFVRVPVVFGYALNTKLGDSFYSPGTYGSSYTISFRTGASLGYRF